CAGRNRGTRPGRYLALLLAVGLAACAGDGSPAGRGRNVYLAQCSTACHNSDPSKDGPLGPAIKGSSRELLEARVLRGAYPPGYKPKRGTAVMQPMPQLTASIDDLAAFLK
ncbi:MAG: cytochrome c, partial [Candidatus Rokubacteria bacterium]|nr:cytochrome c [Candidatus Rokubacteria bacterium]